MDGEASILNEEAVPGHTSDATDEVKTLAIQSKRRPTLACLDISTASDEIAPESRTRISACGGSVRWSSSTYLRGENASI
jgi:hypothetical protein